MCTIINGRLRLLGLYSCAQCLEPPKLCGMMVISGWFWDNEFLLCFRVILQPLPGPYGIQSVRLMYFLVTKSKGSVGSG